MMTIKVSAEKRNEINNFIDELEEKREQIYTERFIFDTYRLEYEVSRIGMMKEADNDMTFTFDIRRGNMKDTWLKARITQRLHYIIDGKDRKYVGQATLTIDKEGKIRLGNMDKTFKELVKAKREAGEFRDKVNMTSTEFYAMVLANVIMDVEFYIMYKLEHREVIIKEGVEKVHRPRLDMKAIEASKKNEGKDLTLDLDTAVRYIKKKGLHKIHCELWGVRGHYRHYKSGKVVFIEAYQKGKKRNTKKIDKTYVV